MAGTRVLLLRGVNVGGANRLPMAEFRALLAGLGLTGVATHVQSGNAVFHDPGLAETEARIAAVMGQTFGFTPALFLYDLPDYRAILAANPFRAEGEAAGDKVHVLFLARPAPDGSLAALLPHAAEGEAMHLTDRALYLHAPAGIGRSKLFERLPRLVPVPQTARNQRSAEAILALAEAVAT